MLAALLLVLPPACANDETMHDPDPDPVDDTLQPPPPEGGQQLATSEYTLEAGQERFLCWTFESPADARHAITQIAPIAGDVVHHILLARTREREAQSHFECDQLIDFNWEPLWAGGAGANELNLPEGVGFMVDASTQYLIQLHLLNASDHAVTERTGLNLTYAPDAAALTAAGFYTLGSFQTVVPAHAMGFQQHIECAIDRDMNVFAVFPHMHQLGKKLEVESGTATGPMEMLYAKDPWVFGDQPMDPVDTFLTNGTRVRTTCTWDNGNDHDVGFGESTMNEMCFSLLFYYPFEGLTACLDP